MDLVSFHSGFFCMMCYLKSKQELEGYKMKDDFFFCQ